MDNAGNLLVHVAAGGAGGGAVTIASTAVASGAYAAGSLAAGAGVDGWNLTEGAKADAACGTSNGTCSIAALIKYLNAQAATLVTNTGAAIPAQSTHTVNIGAVDNISPYPATAVPITASATGTTGATTATLTNVSGYTTYICGYSVRANATAATTVLDTVTGVITATLSSYLWVAPVASGLGMDEQIFSPCIPASAVSTSIAVVSGAPGTGGLVSVKAWGYSL